MAAYRKPDRDGYYIRPTLPAPWNRVGPWSTGLSSKRQAEAVEAWLEQQALERPELIDALVQGKLGRKGLQRAWIAKLTNTLDDLLRSLSDPLIATAAEAFAVDADERARHGLAELGALADQVEAKRAAAEKRAKPRAGTLRLSWLLEARNVTDLYAVALASGRSPNSIKRSVHRAVADLLAHHYGKARRNSVIAEVVIPGERDLRKVRVSAEELERVLAHLEPDFLDLAALAMLLAIDRGPLLRIAPRYFDEALGTLEVLDSKTTDRERTIELSTPAWAILRRRCAGRAPDEPIFTCTVGEARHHWEAARDRAAGIPSRNKRERGAKHPLREEAETLLRTRRVVTLPVLRFKDLRHLLPTAWNALGFSEADLQEIMGHAHGSKQTKRYITARISGDREKMDRVAAYLGLDRLHLRAAGGGAP